MRARSILLTTALLLLCTALLRAQTAIPLTPPPAPADTATGIEDFYRSRIAYGIGIQAGLLSGAGLTARVTTPTGLAAQITGFIITVGDYFHANVGGELQYGFVRHPDARFYAMLGAGFYSSTTSDTAKPGNRIANPFRFGLGIGYEWFASRNLAFDIAGAIHVFPSTGEVYPLPKAGFTVYFR